jgi:integrase
MAGLIGGKRMARARYQEGTLGIEGKGSAAHYYTRFRIYDADGNTRRKQVTIGLVSKLSKREANKRKAEIVASQTSQLPKVLAAQRGEMTFKTFYHDRFLPLKTHWGQPHRESFTYIMKTYVLPKIGGLSLNAIDKVMIQVILNAHARELSKNTISHIRRKMVEVFEEAVEQEIIIRNPATKTHIPEEAAEADETILTKQNLFDLIDGILDPRDRAIFAVGSFCALRTSELFGMSWRAFHYDPEQGESYFSITDTAYRGTLREKTTKTKASRANVTIPAILVPLLMEWRERCPDTSPDALMFPSTNKNGRSQKGSPMCPGIWLQKKVHPVAKAIGLDCYVNFRVTRRTASTLFQADGTSLADTQAHLRHASAATTAKHYSKPIPEGVKRAVNDFADSVMALKPSKKKTKLELVS